jgi:hypothetical protein
MSEDNEGKYRMVYMKCRIGYEKPTLIDGDDNYQFHPSMVDLLLQPRPRTPCS